MSRVLCRIPAVAVVPLVWIGCFSSNSGGGGQGAQFDGFFDGPEFDSSVQETATPDSPTDDSIVESGADVIVDARADGTMDAATEATVDAGTPIVVTVVGAAGPEPGVTIVYDDATGALVGTQTTDASGQALRVVAAGSMVTALLGDPAVYLSPFTIMGVQPGDALTVVDWATLPSNDRATLSECASVDVTAQAAPPANTNFYMASSGLDISAFAQQPLQIALGGQCPATAQAAGPPADVELGASILAGQPRMPVLLEAFDSVDTPIGFLFQKANPLPTPVDGGDAATQQLALAGSWLTSYTSQTLNITNPPDGGMAFMPILSEVVSGTLTTNPQLIIQGGNTFWTHPGFADFVQAEASYSVYYLSGLAMATALPAPASDATIQLDLTPLASMPVLSGASFDSTDPARPKFTWTTSQGSLSSVTGIVVFASFAGGGGDGGPAQGGTWTIVAPSSSQASIQAPALPTNLGADFAPGNIEVWGFQGSALPTYDAVRAAASTFREQPACGIYTPIVPALPAAGTSLMVTMYSGTICN